MLFLCEHDLYRPTGGPAQKDCVGLNLPTHDLRSETAAHVASDASYLDLPVEDMEEGHLVHVRGLTGAPDGDFVRFLPHGHCSDRFRGKGIRYVLVPEGAFAR